MYQIKELFDLSHTIARELFEDISEPWMVLPRIGEFLKSKGPQLEEEGFDHPSDHVWISKTARVAPTASITGPCIICAGAEIRHGAFIRGNALVGENCVVGNSVELKNVILFDNVQVPHYNYVGDSILGYRAHMGAGSITSNVKSDKTLVVVKDSGAAIPTGLKKFGAMLGDFVEVGCNSVLNPGTVIGRGTSVYPLSSVRGVIPEDSIFKSPQNIVKREKI